MNSKESVQNSWKTRSTNDIFTPIYQGLIIVYNRQFYNMDFSILVVNLAEDSDEFLDKYSSFARSFPFTVRVPLNFQLIFEKDDFIKESLPYFYSGIFYL